MRHVISDHPVLHSLLVVLVEIREDDIPHRLDCGAPVGRERSQIVGDGYRLALHRKSLPVCDAATLRLTADGESGAVDSTPRGASTNDAGGVTEGSRVVRGSVRKIDSGGVADQIPTGVTLLRDRCRGRKIGAHCGSGGRSLRSDHDRPGCSFPLMFGLILSTLVSV